MFLKDKQLKAELLWFKEAKNGGPVSALLLSPSFPPSLSSLFPSPLSLPPSFLYLCIHLTITQYVF